MQDIAMQKACTCRKQQVLEVEAEVTTLHLLKPKHLIEVNRQEEVQLHAYIATIN